MKTRRFSYFFAMLAIVLAGCSDIDNVLNPQTDGGETLPFSTVIPAGSAAPTRGLEISTDDKSIKAEWVKGEKIALVHGETIDEMTVSAVDTDGNATITGEVTNYVADETAYLVYAGTRRTDPTDDAILTDYIDILGNAYTAAKTADASLTAFTKEIILKTFDISEQSGTINDINETSDFRLGESKLTKKGAYATLTTSPVLQSQFAVWKLSLRDTTSALSTQALDVYDADGKPVVKGVVSSTSVSDFYYLLPAASNATYTFMAAAADGNIYSCTTKNITLEAGKYYRSTLTLKQDMRATPLTFEANAANATVTFGIADVATNSVSYRQYDSSAKAWTDWMAYTRNTPVELTNIGDKLQFKAENATYATSSSYSNILCNADCYAYGNIMSLTDGDSFSTADELTGSYTFRFLFSYNSYLQIDASRPLLLPAETLKEGCYNAMFLGCTKLTVAPVLPAKTLVNNCYCEMFEGCTNLGSVTCLATDINAANCLKEWLKSAGRNSSCERILYVDPTMWSTELADGDGGWNLGSAGNGDSSAERWDRAAVPHALAKVESTDLGSLVGADGNIYATASQIAAAGTTAIGVIAYLDDANTTDDDEITEKSNGGGHGLVLCLKDAASEVEWSTETSAVEFTGQEVTDNNGLMRLTNVSGYSNTMTLAAKTDAATKYPAAYQAKNYTGLTAPTGTTGWFLPSAQQWVKILQALGGLDGTTEDRTIKLATISSGSFDSNKTSVTKWENAFAKAGAGNYDDMIVKGGHLPNYFFWSSSEYSAEKAIHLCISNSDNSSIALIDDYKWSTARKKVRPFLAF